jgi:hypothetical protein
MSVAVKTSRRIVGRKFSNIPFCLDLVPSFRNLIIYGSVGIPTNGGVMVCGIAGGVIA